MKEEKNQDQQKNEKKLTAFQIASIVLIVLLFVAILIQIGVIISLNAKTNNLTERNEEVAIEQICENFNEPIANLSTLQE